MDLRRSKDYDYMTFEYSWPLFDCEFMDCGEHEITHDEEVNFIMIKLLLTLFSDHDFMASFK